MRTMASAILLSPSARLWLVVLLFCLSLAELGHLFSFIPAAVLHDLHREAPRWWQVSALGHWALLVALLYALYLASRPYLRRGYLPRTCGGQVLAAAVTLLGVYLCLNQYDEMNRVVHQPTDFGTIRLAALALADGGDPYHATNNGYFYPPALAYLFRVLTWLPAAGASLLFFTVKFVMVVWSLRSCDRLVLGDAFPARQRVLFVCGLIFVAARFWMADLQFGNTNVVIMFLVVAAITCDRDNHTVAAGLALAAAISIKISPGVLVLYLLLLGRWRTLLSCLAGLVVINLGPAVLHRETWYQVWNAYLDAGVSSKLNERLAQPDNQSIWGLLNRSFPAVSLVVLRWVWLMISVGLSTLAAWVTWRVRQTRDLAQVAAAALFPLLALLISPGSWVVHYTVVLLPMVVIWRLALGRQWTAPLSWGLLLLSNFMFTMSGWARITVRASINQSWFVISAVLLILGLSIWVIGQPRDPAR